MKRLFNKIKCRFDGHPCVSTGRDGYRVHEWKCERCGDIYISHDDFGNMLLPYFEDFEQLYRWAQEGK